MNIENKEESIVREYFERLGYAFIKLDEDTTQKLPDYLFVKGALWFLAEVKNVEEQNEFVVGSKIVRKITEILEGMRLGFGLSFEVFDGVLEQDLKKREIIRIVKTQLSSPSAKVGDKFEIKGKIRFEIEDIVSNSEKATGLGIYGLAKQVDTPHRIQQDIKEAVTKYKSLDKNLPYVLILFSKRIIFGNDDIITGMFGNIIAHISKDSHDIVGVSRKDSALQSRKNTSISAIASYFDGHFEVFHNPHKAIELPNEVFNQDENIQYYVDDKTGEIKEK